MKIIDTPQPKPVTFGDLKPGDVYLPADGQFPRMKLEERSAMNTVRLTDGVTFAMASGDVVIPCPDHTLYLRGAPEPEIPAEVQAVLDALREYKWATPASFDRDRNWSLSWNTISSAFNAYEATVVRGRVHRECHARTRQQAP